MTVGMQTSGHKQERPRRLQDTAGREAGSRVQGAAHENNSQVLLAAPCLALSQDATQGSEKPSSGRWRLEPHCLAPPPTHLVHATNYEHLPSAGPLLSTCTQNPRQQSSNLVVWL